MGSTSFTEVDTTHLDKVARADVGHVAAIVVALALYALALVDGLGFLTLIGIHRLQLGHTLRGWRDEG